MVGTKSSTLAKCDFSHHYGTHLKLLKPLIQHKWDFLHDMKVKSEMVVFVVPGPGRAHCQRIVSKARIVNKIWADLWKVGTRPEL